MSRFCFAGNQVTYLLHFVIIPLALSLQFCRSKVRRTAGSGLSVPSLTDHVLLTEKTVHKAPVVNDGDEATVVSGIFMPSSTTYDHLCRCVCAHIQRGEHCSWGHWALRVFFDSCPCPALLCRDQRGSSSFCRSHFQSSDAPFCYICITGIKTKYVVS